MLNVDKMSRPRSRRADARVRLDAALALIELARGVEPFATAARTNLQGMNEMLKDLTKHRDPSVRTAAASVITECRALASETAEPA